MNQIFSTISINESKIRKVFHQDEWHYSVTDVISQLLDTDHKRAKNYYHVLKKRLAQNGEAIPQLCQLKAQSSDGKMYLTDFVGTEGIQVLHEYLKQRIKNKVHRMDTRLDDEVECFHPKVQAYLEKMGLHVEHHVRLPSGNTIDFIATSSYATYLIECKPKLNNAKLYSAIGQVICYQSEIGLPVIPTIAAYSSEITEYAKRACFALQIKLIEIEKPYSGK